MAEMTASEAIRILNKSADKALLLENQQYKEEAFVVFLQISALIQQQQQTISELQTEIAYQNKQIARLHEDLSRQVKEGQ